MSTLTSAERATVPVKACPSDLAPRLPAAAAQPVHPLQHLRVQTEPDPATVMRLLGLFALRGHLPASMHFEVRDDHALLEVWARLDDEDFRVLCARAQTLVGVLACETPAEC